MKLTNATEQALAILAILATQQEDIPVSSQTIYKKLSVSQSYIKKLLRKLVVSKVIEGVSGNNGGFFIERNLKDISLLEIVESIEGPFYSFPHIGVLERAFSDFNEIAEDGNKVISQVFNRADYAWNEEIRRVSIQDMLEEVFSGYGEIPKRDWNQWM
ncbi:Rrf2 family transcriptional regulator [Vagococcus sp. DIV0080]|uniref:Rrf2 family transcriptional regulator n=1 Tax=Candidatus Vagococcus giribetii TaxID=2230876 RepID=A0ABS3HS73_9ENTE|nr:Rrf2 family transcriptional regulator [Vagococcus sp. DIV0080]MBO0476611.1 Rrf2 family transcriptional regulator [Vagococcus sp. DIV0080]